MTLAELGETLHEERVRRGYSAEDVATQLKITSRIVRAMEEGDAKALPHAVYACGFIKAYAAFVGLDEDDVRPALACLVDPHEEAQPVTLVPPPRRRQTSSSSGFFVPLLLVATMAAGLFWFRAPLLGMAESTVDSVRALVGGASETSRTEVAAEVDSGATGAEPSLPPVVGNKATPAVPAPSAAQGSRVEQKSIADTPVGVRPAMAEPVPAAPAASSSGAASELNADGLPANMAPAAVNAMSGNPGDSDTPGGAVVQGDTPPPSIADTTLTLHQDGQNATDLTNAGRGKHQIVISALEECWIHSSADGTFTRQFSLKKGETFALSFDKKLVVKLGNAGGVRIKYDGEEMPAAGKPGQVRTLTFPAE